MKIGIVGYTTSGKTTLFELLTGATPDPAQAHVGQSAMAPIPEPRIERLCGVYHPKKITRASLELTDTPGLNRTHEGNAQKLGTLRETGCLVLVVAGYAGKDPHAELRNFEEDLLLADLDIVLRRVEKLRESTKKPRPNREAEQEELEALEPILAHLEAAKPLREFPMSRDQIQATRSFRLLTEKPKLIVVNTADDETDHASYAAKGTPSSPIFAASLGLENELSKMPPDEREAFAAELGLPSANSRDRLLRAILEASGQMLFFTAGEKEVRTWLLPKGGTALDAAAGIHTDLARGFIRAEVMQVDDIVRLGSERELKAAGLLRLEPKDYVIRDGDILNIKFSV